MNKKKILVIDDELSQLELLHLFFRSKGHEVKCASTAEEGLRFNKAFSPDVIILDIRLPDIGGFEVLQELKKEDPLTRTIMVTAYHDMENTINAMKLGACDYVTKPIDLDELENAVNKALRLVKANRLRSFPDGQYLKKGVMVGNSRQMKEIFKTIGILSRNRVTVLIEGETGTGKELIAKAIHNHSANRQDPFIAISCSTIVENLLESELFGHEKGSFTGAVATKKGRFELAGHGTIFLDETGEIPFETQSKLLRFLQEKEFERIGGEKLLKTNARVIAATNRNLLEMVKAGAFREDLYYRLSVAKIHVPPLRERREDIPLLVDHILRKIRNELGIDIQCVEEKVRHMMMGYDWPGNVRQLENVVTQAAIITQGNIMVAEQIVPLLGNEYEWGNNIGKDLFTLNEVEKNHIIKILKLTNWHLAKTANILGVSRPTLRAKIKGYEIAPEQ